ncbi:MAG: VWA domain-containing protein, partial [Myxococcales bacterium]|nr:VWA domain-containing protein [Myxococcales bacterium]
TDATAGTDSITDSNTFTDSNTQTDSNTMTDTETGVDTEPCLDENINFSQKIPTVVLLIDQSGSMVEDFAGDTRWDAVHDALFNPAGVVTQLEGSVRFGLALYTSFNGFDFGECPVIQDVPPALNNAAAMEALYAANVPEEDTPTGDSINAIVPDLQAMPSDGPRIIVLATDGEPDTCEEPDPQNGQQFSVDAAAASFQAGIPVFIISVGNDVSDQHLQDMANAGAGVMGNNPDAPFYKANNQQGLVDAFDQIINGVRDCTLQLDAEIPEGMEGECEVSINGSTVPHGGMNGWSSSGAMEIELQGSACEAIQEGDIDVQITCSCNVIF